MKKPVVIRNYHLTDAVLKQKADEFLALLDRDKTEFVERGYDDAAKLKFTAARDEVDALSSDETLEGAKIVATENKDLARSALEKNLRSIFNMAANKYGNRSATYRTFGSAAISDQPDAELVRTYKVTAKAATANLADLESEGLTDKKIDNLTAAGLAFDDALDAVAQGISDRDLATEARVETLNTLYALLIKYAGIGQDIYYETNEAKYNDYVIYDTPSGLPVEPPVDPIPPVTP